MRKGRRRGGGGVVDQDRSKGRHCGRMQCRNYFTAKLHTLEISTVFSVNVVIQVAALDLGYLHLSASTKTLPVVLLQSPLVSHLYTTRLAVRHVSAEDEGSRRETSDSRQERGSRNPSLSARCLCAWYERYRKLLVWHLHTVSLNVLCNSQLSFCHSTCRERQCRHRNLP